MTAARRTPLFAPRRRHALVLGALVLGGLGCRDLERFDTGESGAYCGRIIDSNFTRSGFAPGLGLRLTLDIDALATAPGTVTTDDIDGPCTPLPQLDHAPLLITPELFADPLSQLEFGSTRDHNFMAWVDSPCLGSALAVVSLMHTGQVEVRLMRRGSGAPEDLSADEFGVFQLERNECDF